MASNATTSISISVGGNNTGSIVVGDNARSTVVYRAERRAEALAALDKVREAMRIDPDAAQQCEPMFADIRGELQAPSSDPRRLGALIDSAASMVTVVGGARELWESFRSQVVGS